MKRMVYCIIALLIFVCCSQPPKKYTIELVSKNGFENDKKELEAVNDSVAYAQALISYYAAKTTVKKYGFEDKYAYVRVYDSDGESLFVKLGSSTIENIENKLGELPQIKEIQIEDKKMPEL